MQQAKVKQSSIPGTPNPEPLGEDAFQLHLKKSSHPTSPELDGNNLRKLVRTFL
jgi:hypothetical protein